MNITRNVEKEYFILKLLTFFRYFGDCLFYGYFFLFLNSKGLDESLIGTICSLTPLVALICNPFWNHLSKNANVNRIIMMIITVFEGVFILLFTQVSVFEMLALLTCLVAFVGSPFYSLHDGFLATYAKTYGKDYTRIRSIGTLAYFFGTIAASVILKVTFNNYDVLLYISGSIFVLISLLFMFIKPIDLSIVDEGKKLNRNYKAILQNKTFHFYMIVYFLVVTVSYSADSFVSLFFTNQLELSPSVWSVVFGAIILTEFIITIILSSDKFKKNVNIIWVIITFLYPLRSLIFAIDIPTPFIIAGALLRGVSYGLLITANVRCIEKICGIENVTVAFFILAIFTAIIQAVSNFTFGSIIEAIGYRMFFLIVAGIGFIGAIINLVYQIANKFEYKGTVEWKENQ